MKRFITVAVAGLMAFSPAAAYAQSAIGSTTKVVRDVTGTLSGNSRTLQVSNNVFASEKVATAPNSATELEFVDGTKLSVGPAADVTLDNFVYDSGSNTGTLALSLAKGTMRFVTGRMAAPAYTLRTPHSTIGIRGTILTVSVLGNLTTVIVEQGLVTVAGAAGVAQTVAAGQATTVPAGGAASAAGAAPGDAVASVNNMDATLARAPGVAATGTEGGAAGLTGAQLGLAAAGALAIGLGLIVLNNDDGDGDATSGTTGTTSTAP